MKEVVVTNNSAELETYKEVNFSAFSVGSVKSEPHDSNPNKGHTD